MKMPRNLCHYSYNLPILVEAGTKFKLVYPNGEGHTFTAWLDAYDDVVKRRVPRHTKVYDANGGGFIQELDEDRNYVFVKNK